MKRLLFVMAMVIVMPLFGGCTVVDTVEPVLSCGDVWHFDKCFIMGG